MGKSRLQPHHRAWLRAHPHRDEHWLIEKLREGFDVHHLDGDHANNCPLNLVMIEHTDHMALHNGGFYTLGRLRPGGGSRRKKRQQEALARLAEDAALAREREGLTWRRAAARFGVSIAQAQAAAKRLK